MKEYVQKWLQYVRKYPLGVSCILLIWVLSFLPFPETTPLEQVPFVDKWTHIVMYGGTFVVVWTEYLRSHHSVDYEKVFFWAWLAPVGMSGAIELLQEFCTTYRGGEWLDLAANATGVTLAAVYGLVAYKLKK